MNKVDKFEGIKFEQANVRVPVGGRPHINAMAATMRAEYLLRLVDGGELEELYAVATLNLVPPPMQVVVEDMLADNSDPAFQKLGGEARQHIFDYQRQVGIIQATGEGSEAHTLAMARAIAAARMADALVTTMKLIEVTVVTVVEDSDD